MSTLTQLHRAALAKIEVLRYDDRTQADKVESHLRDALHKYYAGDLADAQFRELLTSAAQANFTPLLNHFTEVLPSSINNQ